MSEVTGAIAPLRQPPAGPGRQPTKLRVGAVVAVTALGGVALSSVVVVASGDRGLGAMHDFLPLTVALILIHRFPVRVPHHGEAEDLSLQEVAAVPILFLLPPVGVLLAFVIGMAFGNTMQRAPAQKWIFNLGKEAAAVAAGLLLIGVIDPGHAAYTTRSLPAVFVASLLTLVVGTGLVHIVMTTTAGAVPHGLGSALVLDVEVWVTGTCAGLLLAYEAIGGTWRLVFALPLLVVLVAMLSGDIKRRADRTRLDLLLQTAVAAHASMTVDEVEEAITSATVAALQCRSATIGVTPPGNGERGAVVEVGVVPRWLVASGFANVEFGPVEGQLLDGIAAIAAGALENAHLVEQVVHQSLHDPLTGLPNRILLADRTDQAIGAAARSGHKVAVIYIDVDQFKRVNDSLGHAAGDELLVKLGVRITHQVRPGDTASRVGGDEFTVLLPHIDDAAAATHAVERILGAIRDPVLVGGHELFVTASAGIALYPDDGEDYARLLRAADVALYDAKDSGRDAFRVAAEDDGAFSRLSLESDLHRALERDEMRLLYQPQVDLRTGRVVAVEALIRWHHPRIGTVSPDRFLPLAQGTELMSAIDAWVLRSACHQAAAWQAAGLPPLRVAVNLSGRAIQSPGLYQLVRSSLTDAALPAHLLEVEVTEQVAAHQSATATGVLARLRADGVHVALDDFGTGYSSLDRLRSFPLDIVKIDKLFVQEIDSGAGSPTIVVNTIAIAHDLGLAVTAEGVETQTQLELLRSWGCDFVQGYLTGRPEPPESIEGRLLAANAYPTRSDRPSEKPSGASPS